MAPGAGEPIRRPVRGTTKAVSSRNITTTGRAKPDDTSATKAKTRSTAEKKELKPSRSLANSGASTKSNGSSRPNPADAESLKTSTSLTRERAAEPSETQSTSKKPPSQPNEPPSLTSDATALQIAAQLYSWMYMTSRLKQARQLAESSAHIAIQKFLQKLHEEESDIADQRVRFETERLISFYEELASDEIGYQLSTTIQALTKHEKDSIGFMTDALRFAQSNPGEVDYASPMQRPNDLLKELSSLRDEADQLESSIAQILKFGKRETSQIKPVLEACLPALRARSNNLRIARELILSVKENIGLSLESESLRLSTRA